MKRPILQFVLAAAVLAAPALQATTLSVGFSYSVASNLDIYAYSFSASGTGPGFTNFYLGSDDLSPSNVAFQLNGAATSAWSWLGNDQPQNYLQFFALSGATLNPGQVLSVSFQTQFAPGSSFVIGTTSAGNQMFSVQGPRSTPVSPVPEPGTFVTMAMGLVAAAALLRARIGHRA